MATLDPALIARLDRSGMLDRIMEFPEQCLAAWEIVQQAALPERYRQARQIVVLGMGGSAIAADVVQALINAECPVPFTVVRDYELPGFVDAQTLVIGSSYSGQTEETLVAFDQARRAGSMLVAITTGGRLREMAERAGAPVLLFHYPAQPRAAFGYSFMLLLGLLQRLGFAADRTPDLAPTVDLLRRLRTILGPDNRTESNPALQLAQALQGRIVCVYGGGLMGPVARRWKGQVNENSKNWAEFDLLPELHHNAVVGYEHPAALPNVVAVVLLHSTLNHPRIRLRTQITADLLRRRGIPHHTVEAQGETSLAHVLSAIYIGDFVSYYLALLNGVDPSTIEAINYLKNELARAGAPI